MSQAKRDRGQLRQVTKELMPELLTTELYNSLRKEILKELTSLKQQVVDTLEQIDRRSKDTQAFIMREVMSSSPIAPPTISAPSTEESK